MPHLGVVLLKFIAGRKSTIYFHNPKRKLNYLSEKMLFNYALGLFLAKTGYVKIYNTFSKTYKLTFFAQKRIKCANCE